MNAIPIPQLQGKKAYGWALLLFTLIGLAIYGRTLGDGFVVDDWWWAGRQVGHGWMANDHAPLFYRPVVSAFYWAVWSLAGPTPAAFHSLSLALCILTALGIFALSQTLTGNRWVVSLLAGGLFLVNPSHAEPVCWVAGMTDTVSAFFAIWGIVGVVRTFRTGSWSWLALGVPFLVFGMFAKESVVFAPVMACCFAAVLPERKVSRKALASIVGGLFLLIPAYVVFRSRMVTGGVGGYSAIVWRTLPNVVMHWGGMALSNDSFLPIYRPIVLASNLGNGFAIHDLTFALFPAALFVGLQKPERLRVFCQRVAWTVLGLLAFYTLVSPLITFLGVLAEITRLLIPVLVLLAALLVGIFVREGGLNRTREWAARLQARPSLSFAIVAILTVYCVFYGSAFPVHVPIVAMWLGGLGFQWDRVTPAASRLCGIALMALLMWLLAIGPALHLPIGLDGQQARFAYFGSCFSAIALACMLRLIPRVRQWVAPVVLGFSGLWAWQSTAAWVLTGTLSNQTVEAMRQMKDADRIVVLGAPATLDGALLFLGGIEEIPKVMFGSTLRPELVLRMHFATDRDTWLVRPLSDHTYVVGYRVGQDLRVNAVSILKPEFPFHGNVQPVPQGSIIDIPTMTPRTRVMLINTDRVAVLR